MRIKENFDRSDISFLRKRLTLMVLGIRRTVVKKKKFYSSPQSFKNDFIFFEDRLLKRKRIVLLGHPCSTASCTMCPLPNESVDPSEKRVTSRDLIAQFEASFRDDNIDIFDLVTVYNNGNFFVDSEVPSDVRRYIYKRIKKSQASSLAVESLPQFITEEKVKEAKYFLGAKKLVVYIGFQSSNTFVRELAVNSTCTKASFEEAVSLLRQNGFMVSVFLMVKPPFLTEEEAIEDAVESLRYLSSLKITNASLCATRVAPDTLLNLLYQEGKYRSPWLWTIKEILLKSKKLGLKVFPRIVTSEFKKELNPESICASNCDKCNSSVIKIFDLFNSTFDMSNLNKFNCDCIKDYRKFLTDEKKIWENLSLPDRIAQFLENHKNLLS